LRAPSVKLARDGFLLRMPQLGTLIRYLDTARFARTLGVLVTGGVALPNALAMAQGAISNRVIGDAVAIVASRVKEGEGLTVPLAATGVFPKLALGFLRTGEETSQLGPMLLKLADVLDRDIKVRIARLIGLLTPAITVILGVGVAVIIAAIMAGILGFNDLAVSG
jgi:general secretion pathway protein F